MISRFLDEKYKIRDVFDGRPLYLDAQATTPLVNT